MQVDKRNGIVNFCESEHKYWDDNGNDYVSVTTLIHRYTQPFDQDFWSKYKALERILGTQKFSLEKSKLLKTKKWDNEVLNLYDIEEAKFNLTQKTILDEWAKKNSDSCERGTKIHLAMENKFYSGAKSYSLKSYGIGGKFVCKKDYTELDLDKAVYPEYLVSVVDDNLHLAGQIDLFIKDGNDIIIGDYKGLPLNTEIPTLNGWSTIKDLKEGDTIFDKDGNPTKIKHKSKVHFNPCYKITFDNGDSIVADHEHRWEVTINNRQVVMTTEEISTHLKEGSIKILNPKPLNCQSTEIIPDFYKFFSSLIFDAEYLKKFSRSSIRYRVSILNGYIDLIGKEEGEWITLPIISKEITDFLIRLIASLGIKTYYNSEGIRFSFNDNYRIITSVKKVDTVPTQCLEVDSPTHTFLCTKNMIVTHNTNQSIDQKSGYDSAIKRYSMMQYPLNNLMDCNFMHYSMQLSTYAWMLQKINPNFNVKRLFLVHFSHEGEIKIYEVDYLKEEVERMIKQYKKELKQKERELKRKKIEF